MKKCLITGAAGNIGLQLIEELLKTQKYQITALDLKSPRSTKRLKKYQNQINIINGDINDTTLINDLVAQNDYIFHLSAVLPFNAEINYNLATIVNYEGTKNIVDAIIKLNPKAFLIYPSTTVMYGDVKKVKLNSDLNIYYDDYYAQINYQVEKYIEKHVKNYIIYRLPFVLNEYNFDKFMYNLPLQRNIEIITTTMVAKAFCNSLKHKNTLKNKIYILSGGNKYRTNSSKLMYEVLKVNGISFRYFVMYHFLKKNFYGHYYEDDKQLNDILDYQSGSISDVYENISKVKKNKRFINRFFAIFILHKLSHKM